MRVALPLTFALAAAMASSSALAKSPRSPEYEAAKQAAFLMCANDYQTYCDGTKGQKRLSCMRQHKKQLTPDCRDALKKLQKTSRSAN